MCSRAREGGIILSKNASEQGILQVTSSLLKLEAAWFRRFVVISLAVAVAVSFILAAFVDAVDDSLGLKLGTVAVLFLLGVLIEHVIELRKEAAGEVFEDDWEAEARLKAIVLDRKPKTVKLCEYSAASIPVANLIRLVIRCADAEEIKLLLCHPRMMSAFGEDSRNNHQMRRLLTNLEDLSYGTYREEPPDKVPLRIRCYQEPASLRGRNFDDRYIALGWYTYDRKNKRSEAPQLWGAENPVIVAPTRGDDHNKLKDMFNEVFDDIWERAVPLKTALEGYEDQHWIGEEWLAAVSQLEGPSKARQANVDAQVQPNGKHDSHKI
jgi:hypothetical protein